MTVIVLSLPVLSSNKYWRPVQLGKHISIVPTKEAKKHREECAWLARAAGVITPIKGRVAVNVQHYPHRPLDWQTRMRKHGDAWDDTVQSVDLDNVLKVMLDALKGTVFDDDSWVRKLVCERMEPDDKPERLIVTIEPYVRPVPVEQLGFDMPEVPAPPVLLKPLPAKTNAKKERVTHDDF